MIQNYFCHVLTLETVIVRARVIAVKKVKFAIEFVSHNVYPVKVNFHVLGKKFDELCEGALRQFYFCSVLKAKALKLILLANFKIALLTQIMSNSTDGKRGFNNMVVCLPNCINLYQGLGVIHDVFLDNNRVFF